MTASQLLKWVFILNIKFFVYICRQKFFVMENQEFADFLEHRGLSHEKWIAEFSKHNITSEDNILTIKCSDSAATILESFEKIANENELKILKKMLGISNQSQKTGKQSIEYGLESVGLEAKYWAKIFSDKLGITSTEALEFVGSESYPILEGLVRHQWEKKALRELLKLDKEENLLKNQRKKQTEKLKKRQEKAKQLVQQLKDLNLKGKERKDEEVKQTESEIQEMLQIPPHSWIHKDNSLTDLISQVEAKVKAIGGVMQTRSDINDSMVVEHASGGLALTGILLTKNVEEQLQDRKCLLRVPQKVTLHGPSHHQDDWIKEFSSKSQEDSYIKSFSKLGYSASASAQAGFWGFHFEVGAVYADKKSEDSTREAHDVSLYCSTVKHSTMPLASFCFSDRDLLLSEDALSALRSIETQIVTYGHVNHEVEHACEEFLKTFGSHANRGPIHFGGVYLLKCFSTGFKKSELAVVKQLHNEAIGTHAGFSYSSFGISGGVDITRIQANYKGKCSEATISQTHLEVTKSGGPPELSTLTDWKTGLVASNSTWSVIDRGTMLVPVWEILTINHTTELQKISALVDALQKTWESMAELQVHLKSLTPSSEVAELLEEVIQWNKASDLSQEDIQKCIDTLLSVKQNLIKKTMNPKAWSSLYLTQLPLQQFLKIVLDAQMAEPPPPEAAYVKKLMQQLLHKDDLTLTFPYRKEFLQWLYVVEETHKKLTPATVYQSCQNLIELSRYLDLAIDKMRENARKHSSLDSFTSTKVYGNEISAAVVTAIKSLLKTLRQSSKYEFILLSTLIYPFIYDYSHDGSIFLKQFSLNNLEFLSKALQLQRKEFSKIPVLERPMKMQAFLFHLAVNMYCNEPEVDISEMQLQIHIQFVQNILGDEMQSQLKEILSIYLTDSTDWRKFQSHLAVCVHSTSETILRRQSSHSLEHVLKGVPKTRKPAVERSEHNVHEAIQAANENSCTKIFEIRKFFDALDLTKYYPRKLTLQLALCIRQDTLGNCICTDPRNLPFFILRKLWCMTTDVEANFTVE